MTSPTAPGYKLAQLVRPSRKIGAPSTVVAEGYIRHGNKDPHDVAMARFRMEGKIRNGMKIRITPVTCADLGMVELPAVERSGTG